MLCLPFFHGQNISFCYTTGRKLMFWGLFFFLSLSTFFTDKKSVYFFHSKNVSFCNRICRHLMFLNVYFFMSVYFFHVLVPCLPIFTEGVLCSLTPYGKLYCSSCVRFSKIGTMSIIFTVRIFCSIPPKAGKFKGYSCLLFYACLPFSLVKIFSFCKIREISRHA